MEMFIKGDDVLFSEVSPRPHDTGMVTMISQNFSQFALHARAILGIPIVKIENYAPSASRAVVVEGKSDMIEYSGIEKVLARPRYGYADFRQAVRRRPPQNGRLLARGKTIEDADAVTADMLKDLEIKLF